MLLAEPIRALMDLVCLRKTKWQGMNWLLEGLRVDGELLKRTTPQQLRSATVYKQERVRLFLLSLRESAVIELLQKRLELYKATSAPGNCTVTSSTSRPLRLHSKNPNKWEKYLPKAAALEEFGLRSKLLDLADQNVAVYSISSQLKLSFDKTRDRQRVRL
jgi:hypothetical protein